METDQKGKWNGAELKVLTSLLEQIIPANPDRNIPSAGTAETLSYLSDIAATDGSFQQAARRGLARAADLAANAGGELDQLDADQRVALVRQLETIEPAFFETLLRHTYMGYYSRPEIRALFGLSAKPTQPEGYSVAAESIEFMSEMTEPVVRRGRIFRPC
ncbi:MAG: gluconate 2-dehydrogenase subunit 3 family protein [Alphaproteobacteria bacterium]|nr:gluconate 2-dehydrogenase subunit 3 family protein [Alphaproteobacteria bacterium]